MTQEPRNETIIVQQEEVNYKGHVLTVETQAGGVEFNRDHKELLLPIFEFFWSVDPQSVRNCQRIVSTPQEGTLIYGRFPENGWVANSTDNQFTIMLTRRGMQSTIPHRISGGVNITSPNFISNFAGTIGHEFTHNRFREGGYAANPFPNLPFNNSFCAEWMKRFNWLNSPYDDPSGVWTQVEGGLLRADRYFIGDRSLQYTTRPDLCIGGIGGYAASHPIEDVCDSFAGVGLHSPLLHESKRDFIQEQIEVYKAKHS